MNRFRIVRSTCLGLLTLTILLTSEGLAQAVRDGQVALIERNMSGPRLGLTYIGLKDHLRPYVNLREFHHVVSQFGWHSEWQVLPAEGGPQFVIQLVSLLAGVEYGWFRPSWTLAMGIRFPSGVEGGLGPNVQFSEGEVTSGLILGAGKTFQYGGVNLPVNLAYMVHSSGNRVSLIIGYAIQRDARVR